MNEWDMDHTGRTSFGESDMTTNTGGPAFPAHPVMGQISAPCLGMTLIDYFATHASEEDIKYWQPMGAMVAKVKETGNGKMIYHEPGMYTREIARYRYADAMLKEREA
jgi:hypothetical protein